MARQLATAIQRDRKRGVDVVAERKSEKERKNREVEERAAHTFGKAALKFCTDHKPERDHRLRHWRYTARVLGIDYPLNGGGKPSVIPGSLADTWADKPLADIDDHDVHVAVREARDRGIPGLNRRNKHRSEAGGRSMHSALNLLFTWALDERFDRRLKNNPCWRVRRPRQAISRDRVLTEAEVRLFWNATEQMYEPYRAVFRILLLTGCRREEARGMRWAELSEDLATWTIPSARTKNWREHVLALPPLARTIISNLPRIESDYVFMTSGSRRR